VSFPPEEPSGCFAEMTPGVFFASAEPLFASPEKQVTPARGLSLQPGVGFMYNPHFGAHVGEAHLLAKRVIPCLDGEGTLP